MYFWAIFLRRVKIMDGMLMHTSGMALGIKSKNLFRTNFGNEISGCFSAEGVLL